MLRHPDSTVSQNLPAPVSGGASEPVPPSPTMKLFFEKCFETFGCKKKGFLTFGFKKKVLKLFALNKKMFPYFLLWSTFKKIHPNLLLCSVFVLRLCLGAWVWEAYRYPLFRPRKPPEKPKIFCFYFFVFRASGNLTWMLVLGPGSLVMACPQKF